jgi:hypothetical protein
MGGVNDQFSPELVRRVTGDALLLAVPCTHGGTRLRPPLPNGGWMDGVIPQYMKNLSTTCSGEKENDEKWNANVRP